LRIKELVEFSGSGGSFESGIQGEAGSPQRARRGTEDCLNSEFSVAGFAVVGDVKIPTSPKGREKWGTREVFS
jgi:hypothetical protein